LGYMVSGVQSKRGRQSVTVARPHRPDRGRVAA
jgi:hypothetical protein